MAGFAFNEAFSRDESAQDDHQAQIDARSVARQLNAQEEKSAFLHARAASGADAAKQAPPPLLKAGAKPKPKPVAAIPTFMQRKRPAAGDGAAAASSVAAAEEAAPAPAPAAKKAKPEAESPAAPVSLVAYGESSDDEAEASAG